MAISAYKLRKTVSCEINLLCKISKHYSVVHKHNEDLEAYKVALGLLLQDTSSILKVIHI